MKTKTTSRFSQFIQDQYDMEVQGEYHKAASRPITITFTADDACMFAAIAKRFGKSNGRRDNVRKAYVMLKPGQELNLGGEAA